MSPKAKKEETASDPLEELLGVSSETPDASPDAVEEVETPNHATRVNRVCAALENCQSGRQEFLKSGFNHPHDALLHSLEELLIEIARDNITPWPPSSWPFLLQVANLAHQIHERGPSWQSPTMSWSSHFWELLGQVYELRKTLTNPPEPEAAKVVELETLEELVEQKVRDHNIASIYNWTLPNGEPDIQRVRKAKKEGGEKPPSHHTFPMQSFGPRRQPSLVLVDQLAESFIEDRAQSEEMQPV